MTLRLIKTTEHAELVCKSDPAIGEETDEWVDVSKAKGAKKKGATIIVVRALNDRELMKCSGTFRSIDYESVGEASTLQLAEAMEKVISASFVRCKEGKEVCEDVDVVLQSLKLGPLLALGSWVLAASGLGTDPT
tara:strand:+ start:3194 stop:3598 length:405 start_codon:yes stop_codon:yes gene_type:complete